MECLDLHFLKSGSTFFEKLKYLKWRGSLDLLRPSFLPPKLRPALEEELLSLAHQQHGKTMRMFHAVGGIWSVNGGLVDISCGRFPVNLATEHQNATSHK